jgi:hypothetical protein
VPLLQPAAKQQPLQQLLLSVAMGTQQQDDMAAVN